MATAPGPFNFYVCFSTPEPKEKITSHSLLLLHFSPTSSAAQAPGTAQVEGWGEPEPERSSPGPVLGRVEEVGFLVTSSSCAVRRAGPERDSAAGGPWLAWETKLREEPEALAAAGPDPVVAAAAALAVVA